MICKECGSKGRMLWEGGTCKKCFDKKPVVFLDDDLPSKKPKSVKGKKKICPECRTRFIQNAPTQKYCRSKCTMKASNRAKRKREEPNMTGLSVMMCKRPECGKMFQQKHANERMCSPECAKAHKTKNAKELRAKKRAEKA